MCFWSDLNMNLSLSKATYRICQSQNARLKFFIPKLLCYHIHKKACNFLLKPKRYTFLCNSCQFSSLGSTLFLTFTCAQSLWPSYVLSTWIEICSKFGCPSANRGGHGGWHIRETRMLMNVSSQSWNMYIFDVSGSDHNFKGITSAVYMVLFTLVV
jgi:hypothetical protein